MQFKSPHWHRSYGIFLHLNLRCKPFVMEINKILNADILDIIFEGRNKEYGAYELRKTYNGRLRNALIGTASVVVLLFVGFLVSSMSGGDKKKAMVVQDVQLEDIKEEKKNEP